MPRKERLKPLPVDIDYLDPVTMQKVCSFNQCIAKFTKQSFAPITFTPRFNGYQPITKYDYFHECVECGRKHKSKKDKGRSWSSFLGAAAGGIGDEVKAEDHDEFIANR